MWSSRTNQPLWQIVQCTHMVAFEPVNFNHSLGFLAHCSAFATTLFPWGIFVTLLRKV